MPITWREFQKKMPHYSEHELMHLLEQEMQRWKRLAFAERIHQRLCQVRMMRERLEILKKLS